VSEIVRFAGCPDPSLQSIICAVALSSVAPLNLLMRFTQAGVAGKSRLGRGVLVGEKLKHVQRENVVRVWSLPRHNHQQEDDYSQDR
jgi:hypothetical protein